MIEVIVSPKFHNYFTRKIKSFKGKIPKLFMIGGLSEQPFSDWREIKKEEDNNHCYLMPTLSVRNLTREYLHFHKKKLVPKGFVRLVSSNWPNPSFNDEYDNGTGLKKMNGFPLITFQKHRIYAEYFDIKKDEYCQLEYKIKGEKS